MNTFTINILKATGSQALNVLPLSSISTTTSRFHLFKYSPRYD